MFGLLGGSGRDARRGQAIWLVVVTADLGGIFGSGGGKGIMYEGNRGARRCCGINWVLHSECGGAQPYRDAG